MEKNTQFHLIALGDSLTTAFNADSSRDNHAFSWSTGFAPGFQSHAARIGQALPVVTVVSKNLAVSGVRASGLSSQIKNLTVVPDYATILVGANDLTDWITLAAFKPALLAFTEHLEQAIVDLTKKNPRIMILLSAIPDQSMVVDALLSDGSGELHRYAPWLNKSVLPQLRNAYRERHTAAVSALAQVAERFPKQVKFAARVATLRFSSLHLCAHDRYHPSIAGQSLLADISWQEGWFP